VFGGGLMKVKNACADVALRMLLPTSAKSYRSTYSSFRICLRKI
jgi:hypothetical protein